MDRNDFPKCIQIFERDKRLNVWHFAILTAIVQLAVKQGRSKGIKVSRRRIMTLAHITTAPTYHKYFKELQMMGYCNYRPSYHPGLKSELEFLIEP